MTRKLSKMAAELSDFQNSNDLLTWQKQGKKKKQLICDFYADYYYAG